ncbi:ATP-binding cassette domain-containing protein [Candidatus Poribacteria bacterium]|nr:ATP-binding cassette domain-containing protein [Candidatus Poribacteria bacterium]
MIEARDLTKHYGTYVGIEDVSFSVARGEVVGFLGPNGAGKTTTMRVLTCSMPATSGTASVCGYDVLKDSLEVRRHTGYLPESPPIYLEMSVVSYLRFVGEIKSLPVSLRRTRLDAVLEVCGLGDVRNRIIGQLSKGYRQRVGLAQALIHDPDVLVLDEPTSGLDPSQIIEIRQLIRELGASRTVILSTHILPEASMTCQRLLVIAEGRLVGDVALDARGEVKSVRRPDGSVIEYGSAAVVRVEVRGKPSEVQGRLAAVPGVVSVDASGDDENDAWTLACAPDADPRPEIVRAVVAAGADLLEMREVRQSVEQVFLDLTQTDFRSRSEPEASAA